MDNIVDQGAGGMSGIEHWTTEDREWLVLVTLGAFGLPDRRELVRRITANYVPRRQLEKAIERSRGAIAEVAEAGDRLAVMLRASFRVDGYGSPEHEERCREALREWAAVRDKQ